jgi:RNA polymerase sigma factor (sigma-70 family)
MAPPLTRLLRQLHRLAAPPAIDSDAELLGRFVRCRDESAFAGLVTRHGPMVRNVCRRLLGDWHAAEDACQATFLVLARRAGSLRRPAALAGWLYAVAYRVALRARAGLARQKAGPLPAGDDATADLHPDPLAQVSARELLCVVEEEVRRLPESYRLPVALCCLEGLSQDEAALRLGCTAGAVKGRLERGRLRLRRRLEKRGLVLSAALAAAAVARERGLALAAPSAPASAGAAALAKGVLRMMHLQRLGSVVALVILGAACLVAGALSYTRLAAAPPETKGGDAAPAAKADALGKGKGLWAALGVGRPLFQVGEKGGPKLTFGLVNDGDKAIDPKISSSKMLVNGKALPGFMRALDRPNEARFRSLPPGDYLLFTVVLGDYFKKPGVYRLSWEAEDFRAPELVFRVLPASARGAEGGLRDRREAALTLRQLGDLDGERGKLNQAEVSYRQALDLQEKLVRDFPTVRAYRSDLAGTLGRLGNLQRLSRRVLEAERTLRKALAIQEKLVAEAPDDREQRRELGANYRALGQVLRDAGRLNEAEAFLRRALEIQKSLEGEGK